MARILDSGLLALSLSALAAHAHAGNGLFCQGTLAYSEGYYVCVGSQANADYDGSVASLGLGPDRIDTSQAATGEVGTSSFGLASAEASAKVGVLSGKTHAEVLTKMPAGEQDSNWRALGLASAAFRDTVLIQGQPGVPLGTPVTAHLRTKVQGAFSSASAKGVLGAQADFTGQIYLFPATGGKTELNVPLSGVFWSYEGHTSGSSDTLLTNIKTGDSLDVRWALRIESFVNQVSTLPQTDSEIVAQLFIDLDPTIAVAVGQTAYGYRSDPSNSGEAGAGGEAGSGAGSEAGSAGEAAGGAGGEQAMAGAAGSPDSGGTEAGGRGGAASSAGGSARAGAAQGGAGQPSPNSSGCSVSVVRTSTAPVRLPFAFALGCALLALVRRRRSKL